MKQQNLENEDVKENIIVSVDNVFQNNDYDDFRETDPPFYSFFFSFSLISIFFLFDILIEFLTIFIKI